MATLQKRGRSFVLNWRQNGQQHRVSLGPIPQAEAEKLLRLKEAELLTGVVHSNEPRITFSEFATDYIDWHKFEHPASTDRVFQIIRDHLAPTFRHVALADISPVSVEKWKLNRQMEGAAPATVGKELRTLRAILNKAVRWEVIQRHRIADVKQPKLLNDAPPPFYTSTDLSKLYTKANHSALWRFMANTGLRRNELMNAKREDIIDGTLRVLSSAESRTKSARWRAVPLSVGAQEALKSLGATYLVPRIDKRSLSRWFKQDAAAAGLPGSIHWLRHTFCSHLVMAGVDLTTVKELAGHASINTTMNYSHLSAAHLKKAVAGLKI